MSSLSPAPLKKHKFADLPPEWLNFNPVARYSI